MEPAVAHGELLSVPERLIIAPAPGRFRPVTGDPGPDEGGEGAPTGSVGVMSVIGYVDGIGHSTPVRSPFPGRLMGLLAHAGERVREGQPVAWLRLAH